MVPHHVHYPLLQWVKNKTQLIKKPLIIFLHSWAGDFFYYSNILEVCAGTQLPGNNLILLDLALRFVQWDWSSTLSRANCSPLLRQDTSGYSTCGHLEVLQADRRTQVLLLPRALCARCSPRPLIFSSGSVSGSGIFCTCMCCSVISWILKGSLQQSSKVSFLSSRFLSLLSAHPFSLSSLLWTLLSCPPTLSCAYLNSKGPLGSASGLRPAQLRGISLKALSWPLSQP